MSSSSEYYKKFADIGYDDFRSMAIDPTLSPVRGIETMIHYPTPPHRQAAYFNEIIGEWPIADASAAQVLSLPIWPGMAGTDVDRVIETCLALN